MICSLGGRAFVVPHTTANWVEASLAQWTGAITYGLTNRIDVSLAVPVGENDAQRAVECAHPADGHRGCAPSALLPRQHGSGRASAIASSSRPSDPASGVGNLIVRVKANALREGHRALAVGMESASPAPRR